MNATLRMLRDAGRWAALRILLTLAILLPPATMALPASSPARAATPRTVVTAPSQAPRGSAVTTSSATGGYTVALASPAPPSASTRFTWTLSGTRPSAGREISALGLLGCWSARQVQAATVQTKLKTSALTPEPHTGAITVTNLSDAVLPATIAVTFTATFSSAPKRTLAGLLMGSGRSISASVLAVAGPTCKAPTSTPTATDTDTPTATATDTDTPSPTQTATDTPTDTATSTETQTPTDTPTETATPTDTPTDTPPPTDTPTDTPTPTETDTPTDTPTPTETATPTRSAPDAPADVTATGGNASATVRWTAPAADGGSPITDYKIYVSDGSVVDTDATATSAVVPGLTNGATYTFTVSAVNAIGEGPRSAPSSPITPATVPDAPTGITVVAGADAATVNWAAPISGGSPITGYTVLASDPSIAPVTVDGNTTSVAFRSLTTGASYTFAVAASNAEGEGSFSAASDPITALPPDPDQVAPALDQSVATDLNTATQFLYSGSNPIQVGVAPGTIAVTQTAALRGTVLTQQGQPLSGVAIGVLGHPEYGQTWSRTDGRFDMVVNGGGSLTVTYAKSGYLPVQRQIQVPWQDYTDVPDVMLLPYDSHVTPIDLSDTTGLQVARGSVISDTDGQRQATLLFPPGETAVVTRTDGTTQTLSTLHVRATEFTVGASGPEAMPGDLPPNSGYTYAVDFSADEALTATSVGFSQPVVSYVDNFLGFPIGQAVPAGYYDQQQGRWIAAPNGVVLRILDITTTNGMTEADLDLGAGQPATSTVLAAMGITDAERAQLAKLYTVGQSLWRIPLQHFTPWDFNWPFGPPPDATGPNVDDPTPDDGPPPDCEHQDQGSIIYCEAQTLGERVPVAGTGMTLNYASDRVPGRKDAYSLKIPLSGASVPASLKDITLEVTVAGRTFMQSFPAAPNESVTFAWDGKDAYGRATQGKQPITVRIGYVYPGVYLQPSELPGLNYNALFGHFSYYGIPASGDRSRMEVTLYRDWQGFIGGWDARSVGLGGWTLDVHHGYDSLGRVTYFGDGTRRTAGIDIITVAAGRPGNIGGGLGDGGPATSATMNNPTGVAVAPDGTLYVSVSGDARIRRVTPNGIITTVAGGGPLSQNGCINSGICGDGGPATQAVLVAPQGVALGPDGSLYIADTGDDRIRRVGPDGIITTVAGTGAAGNSGDGGPATQAKINSPQGIAVAPDGTIYVSMVQNFVRRIGPDGIISTVAGGASCIGNPDCGNGSSATHAQLKTPRGLALGPDGSLYIADPTDERIRRVGPDGIITTVAGSGSPFPNQCTGGPCGDGGPATQAALGNPQGVAVGADGTLYIADGDNLAGGVPRRVRAVRPDGTIISVAGSGQNGVSVNGQPATSGSLMDPNAVATAPDGSLYVADHRANCVYRVKNALPGVAVGTDVLASADGSELYYFDAQGRHLKTVDALTGALRYSFGYDAAGHLATITDGDGNITRIDHDAAGYPTAIVAPFGQRTTLTTDANGYLSSIADPLGNTTTLTSTADGLLTGFSDPNGNLHQFTYDSEGRLATDADPAGGLKTLSRVEVTDGYTVTVGTALDATRSYTTTYGIHTLANGALNRITITPDGHTTTITEGTNGSVTTVSPDGTTETLLQGPDPRFGMQAPVPISDQIRTPGGHVRTTAMTRTVALADPTDLLSLRAMTGTATLNGRITTTIYNGASRTITATTPLGRQRVVTLDTHGRMVGDAVPGRLPLQYSYDGFGRLTTIVQGTRAYTTTYDAQGNLVGLTDPLGRTTGFTPDTAGRVITQTLPDGSQIGFDYDQNGNVTSLTPPGQPAHLFTYTPVDLPQDYTPPSVDGSATTTHDTYTRDRQPASVTRPDGSTIGTGYDDSGRLSAVTTPRGATRYAYDPTTGNLTGLTDPDGGTISYSYDGVLQTGRTSTGAITGSVADSYDNDFRLAAEAVSGADLVTSTVTYGYDADSLLTSAGPLGFSYDPQNGSLTGSALGSITDTLGYNGFGEVASYQGMTATAGAPAFATAYTRDALGRITQITETVLGATHVYSYSYDLAGRLAEVDRDGALVERYSYDANGNRTGVTTPAGTVTATYDAQDRLRQYGTTAYTYTASGELQTKTDSATGATTRYSYDALGNLMAVTLPDGTAINYVIDGASRRTGKRVNGTLAQGFVYSAQESGPVAELDGQGNVVSRFVYATRDNVPDYMVKAGTTYRIITDHLGSPRLVVNAATGEVVQRMDYDAFGNVTTDTNPGFQPFGFAGGLYDPDTGLVRFGARDYDPITGRWTGKDPIGFDGGDTNLYRYALGDPINNVDRTGLDGQSSTDDSSFMKWVKGLKIVKKICSYAAADDDARIKKLQDFDRKPGDAMKEYNNILDKVDKPVGDGGVHPFGDTVGKLWEKAANALSGQDSPSSSPPPTAPSKQLQEFHWDPNE